MKCEKCVNLEKIGEDMYRCVVSKTVFHKDEFEEDCKLIEEDKKFSYISISNGNSESYVHSRNGNIYIPVLIDRKTFFACIPHNVLIAALNNETYFPTEEDANNSEDKEN